MRLAGLAFCCLLASGQATQVDIGRQGKNVVPAAAGVYGDATHTIQLTIDGSGRITNLVQVGVQGGTTQSTCGFGSGTFLAMSSFSSGLYVALDQPAGQQLYQCVNGTCAQVGNIGDSGFLQIAGGSLDVNLAVMPRKTSQNTWDGLQTMAQGLSLLTTNAKPACIDSLRLTLWAINNGTAKDTIQACVFDGTRYAWVNLY